MKIHRIKERTPYTGRELAPHWIYQTTGIVGDALVTFEGPADVALGEMVDLEDVREQSPITSPRMVHFIGEWFRDSLTEGILIQHHLVRAAYEYLWEKGVKDLRREGDDIFYKDRKLSVSIATRTPVSVLVHTAFNVGIEGTPVPTAGLNEMDVDPEHFAMGVLYRMDQDMAHWQRARCKVSPRLAPIEKRNG